MIPKARKFTSISRHFETHGCWCVELTPIESEWNESTTLNNGPEGVAFTRVMRSFLALEPVLEAPLSRYVCFVHFAEQ